MTAEAILWAKLVGRVRVCMGWIWFGCMITIAILTGGVHLRRCRSSSARGLLRDVLHDGRHVVLHDVQVVDARRTVHGADDTASGRRALGSDGLSMLPAVALRMRGGGNFFKYASSSRPARRRRCSCRALVRIRGRICRSIFIAAMNGGTCCSGSSDSFCGRRDAADVVRLLLPKFKQITRAKNCCTNERTTDEHKINTDGINTGL